jgi:two-component system, NtrC family, response regulator AtoC
VRYQLPQSRSDDSAHPRCKVMVVEDDASSRKALVLLLKHLGFESLQASSVAEALTILAGQPHVMILDLMLPDGSGGQVLEHVRKLELPIQVAVATGAADWRTLVDEKSARPDAVFIKPLDFPRLVKWIDSACSRAN